MGTSNLSNLRSSAALAVFAVSLPGIAMADQSSSYNPIEPRLTYAVSMYLWGSALNGTERIGGLPPVDVDLSFGDVLDALDFAAVGLINVQGDRFGFMGELNYAKLSGQGTGPGGLVTGFVDVKSSFALAAVTYRVAEEDWGSIDLIGGAKYFKVSTGMTLSPPARTGSFSDSWVDATIGAKGNFVLAPDWTFSTWAMVGAGGSDLSWDVLGTIDYHFSPRWSVSAGFRATSVDYTSGQFDYDMVQSGPLIAVTARF